jgi:Cytochrome P460
MMSPISTVCTFVRENVAVTAIIAVVLAVTGGRAISAPDKYAVQVPNGLSFSEFRGYEDWQAVAVSQTEAGVQAVILANPVMIDAYRAGVPGNGKPFPDGAKIAKIHWKAKKSTEAPDPTMVPGTLENVDFIEKDSRKFPNTSGWGYAQFNYDPAAAAFTPDGTGSDCGYACHTIVGAKDYIFTAYGTR